MSRCRACGKDMKYSRINKLTNEPEELCSECLVISLQTAYNTDYETQDSDDELVLDLIDWREE